MRILVTNDDGYQAEGLQQLVNALNDLGEITIVAPAQEMSGVSHGITIRTPLLVRKSQMLGFPLYVVSGTPADCVKLGITQLIPQKPDLVLSGINQGPNTGINIFYSGTVAAATEAALMGVPAIAVSLASFKSKDFTVAAEYARRISLFVFDSGLPKNILLNVNVPNLPLDQIKGIRYSVQGKGRYEDSYLERRDPRGESYFWLYGYKKVELQDPDEDDNVLADGYVAITPLRAEVTAPDFKPIIDKLCADMQTPAKIASSRSE
jgi:5'-nucleotidase